MRHTSAMGAHSFLLLHTIAVSIEIPNELDLGEKECRMCNAWGLISYNSVMDFIMMGDIITIS
jgi:hypothetical protein